MTLVNNKVLKSTIWYTLSNFLLRGISIFTAPIFTRILSLSDYGTTSNFIAVSGMLYSICSFGITYSVPNGYIDYKKNFDEYLSSMIWLSLIISCINFLVVYIFKNTFSQLFNIDSSLVVYMFIYLAFVPILEIIQSKYRFMYNYKINVIISFVSTFLNIIISFTLIFMLSSQSLARILGLTLPTILISLIFLKNFLNKNMQNHKDLICTWKYILKISLPMVPHALSTQILNQMDRLQITKEVGESYSGLYSFAYTYGSLLSLLGNAINQAILPWLYDKFEKKEYLQIKRVYIFFMMILMLASLFLIFVSPEMITVLGPNEYRVGIKCIPPIIGGIYCQIIYSSYSSLALYHKRSMSISIFSIIAALTNYILNIILIQKYGYIAAAYTTFISYFILLLLHMINCRFTIRVEVLPDKILLLSCIFILIVLEIVQICNFSFHIRFMFALFTFGLSILILYLVKKQNVLK